MKNNNLIVIIAVNKFLNIENIIDSLLNQEGVDKFNILLGGKISFNKSLCIKLKKKYKSNIFIPPVRRNDYFTPGNSRNICLRYLYKNKNFFLKKSFNNWVFFLDDDIFLVDKTYIKKLIELMIENNNILASIGKIESRPENIFNKIIDYSNFWWLQLNYDNFDLKWMGFGATLINFLDLNNEYISEKLIVGEDVDFFKRLMNRTKKTLVSISNIKAFHFHNRGNLFSLIKYQFLNGFYHRDWYYDKKISVIKYFYFFLITGWSFYKLAYISNPQFYKNHKLISLGVIISFYICQLGVLIGSILSKFNVLKDEMHT